MSNKPDKINLKENIITAPSFVEKHGLWPYKIKKREVSRWKRRL
jgi:hypothetical protein